MTRKIIFPLVLIIFVVSTVLFAYADISIPSDVKNEYKYGTTDKSIITIKKRLQELGYYSKSAQFSDSVGSNLKDTVKVFQEKNGLNQDGKLDQTLFNVLFSDNAVSKQGKKLKEEETTQKPIDVALTFYKSSVTENTAAILLYNISGSIDDYSNIYYSCIVKESDETEKKIKSGNLTALKGHISYKVESGISTYVQFHITDNKGNFYIKNSDHISITNRLNVHQASDINKYSIPSSQPNKQPSIEYNTNYYLLLLCVFISACIIIIVKAKYAIKRHVKAAAVVSKYLVVINNKEYEPLFGLSDKKNEECLFFTIGEILIHASTAKYIIDTAYMRDKYGIQLANNLISLMTFLEIIAYPNKGITRSLITLKTFRLIKKKCIAAHEKQKAVIHQKNSNPDTRKEKQKHTRITPFGAIKERRKRAEINEDLIKRQEKIKSKETALVNAAKNLQTQMASVEQEKQTLSTLRSDLIVQNDNLHAREKAISDREEELNRLMVESFGIEQQLADIKKEKEDIIQHRTSIAEEKQKLGRIQSSLVDENNRLKSKETALSEIEKQLEKKRRSIEEETHRLDEIASRIKKEQAALVEQKRQFQIQQNELAKKEEDQQIAWKSIADKSLRLEEEAARIKKEKSELKHQQENVQDNSSKSGQIDYHTNHKKANNKPQHKSYPIQEHEETETDINIRLMNTDNVITNSIFSLDFTQISPCSANASPRNFILRFQDCDDTVISDEKDLTTDKTNETGLSTRLTFQLQSGEYNKASDYWLVIIDKKKEAIIHKILFRINLSFTLDFDF